MPKEKSKPELYILFHSYWFKPSDLIKRGIKKSTAYNYYWKYNKKVKPILKEYINWKKSEAEK